MLKNHNPPDSVAASASHTKWLVFSQKSWCGACTTCFKAVYEKVTRTWAHRQAFSCENTPRKKAFFYSVRNKMHSCFSAPFLVTSTPGEGGDGGVVFITSPALWQVHILHCWYFRFAVPVLPQLNRNEDKVSVAAVGNVIRTHQTTYTQLFCYYFYFLPKETATFPECLKILTICIH